MISKELNKKLLKDQKNEITEHFIYKNLASSIKNKKNKEILTKISSDELKHYNIWKSFTKKEVSPSKLKIVYYTLLAKTLGLTFALKLMEKGESLAQEEYLKLAKEVPEAKTVMQDEKTHEKKLIDLLDEEKLNYVGSIVLGINDALVELTGALAGLTLAFQNTSLIAVAGLITGIAASLSMGASEYLSTKSEQPEDKTPLKASIYTGIAYFITVILIVLPFLLIPNPFIALPITLVISTLIILAFTYYTSIAQELKFKSRFLEMFLLSMSVAVISFCIGLLIRNFLHIDI
jgi:vacuolar iron transporter family protein